MKVTTYLNFNGTCAEALALYAQTLGGEITFLQTFGETPSRDYVAPEAHGQVMHATLMIGDQEIMASDAPGEMYAKPQGFGVTLGLDDPDAAQRIFAAFADGGTVTMPLEATFWAPLFGMVTDRFGTPWMINCETKVA